MKGIKKIFEQRRSDLISLLKSGDLELEKQHQVYGAIREIEVFINTIDAQETPIHKRRLMN